MSTAAEVRLARASRRRSRTLDSLRGMALATDTVIVVLAMVSAVLARELLWPPVASRPLVPATVWFAPLLAATWLACLMAAGAYRASLFGAGPDEYKTVARGSLAAAALGGVVAYLTDVQISRSFFVTAFVIGTPTLLAGRLVLRRGLHRARRAGRLTERTLIMGSPDHVDALARVLRREPWLGYHVVGALTPTPESEETATGVPVMGRPTDAAEIAQAHGADVLFVADGAFGSPGRLRQLAWQLEHQDVQVIIAPGVTDVSRERIRVRPVGGLPLMHLESPRSAQASQWAKRAFDLSVAATALFLLAPLLLVLAVVVYAHDRGPVVFRQRRVGRGGSVFMCLKFRTMSVDSESRLAELKQQQGFDSGLFKMRHDPRVTAPGRWMRRLSLDELPQLVNVLRGDMSLIGPRPPLPDEVAEYDEFTHRRLRVLPGMTGLWQVSGRSHLTFEEAIRLDLYYVDNWSMLQDLAILARTFRAVISARGAY